MIRSPIVGKTLMWQTASSSRPWSAAAGPAGRRLATSFSVGLARSSDQGGNADRRVSAGRTIAASLHDSVSVVAQESAAHGGVGGGELSEGTDERASQSRCLKLGDGGTSDAGTGLAPRSRGASREKSSPGDEGTGWCRHLWQRSGHEAV